jgi:penicillin-binding protein 1A
MDDPLRHFQQAAPATRVFWTFRRVLALVLLLLALGLLWLFWALPVNRALEPLPKPTLVLLDRDGEAFARRGATKLEPVQAERLPKHVVDAFVSIEDRRFFEHDGIDPRGIARAMRHNLRAHAFEQGGSTITQQLAKTTFLTPERTLRRKLQELLLAFWLEARLDKQEILSRYLSSIYFGDGVYGLRAASQHYFGLPPERLDVAQAAMLAGLVKAPSALAPTEHPREAAARTRVVLAAMVDNGVLSADEAGRLPIPPVIETSGDLPVGTWFADWVSPQAREEFDSVYGELRVRTTVDRDLQRLAERVMARQLRGLPGTQAALVAMRPDGEVLALVGGRDYAASPYDRATQARRQPGSAFKPFVYYAALREGLRPGDTVEDAPVSVDGWTPVNYDGDYRGEISVREAFARSSNVAAVRVAQRVGAPAVVATAREFGIEGKLGTDASIALGSYETTLLELTSAYAAFAEGAAPVRAYGLFDRPSPAPRRALDPQARADMLELLRAAVEQGTGRAARLRIPAFGKTGTTQDHRDALFVGFAGDVVTGVWVGNDDNAPMPGVTGGSVPARIWHDFMAAAARDSGTDLLREPPLRELQAWPLRRFESAPAPRPERARRAWFARGNGHGHGKGKRHKRH